MGGRPKKKRRLAGGGDEAELLEIKSLQKFEPDPSLAHGGTGDITNLMFGISQMRVVRVPADLSCSKPRFYSADFELTLNSITGFGSILDCTCIITVSSVG